MSESLHMPDAHTFTHEAMNTTFCVRLCVEKKTIAAGMARECFELIDQLENQLSRYVEGSDVSQINHMQAGETLYISQACHECLLVALDAAARTAGLFDITLGSRIEHQKNAAQSPLPELAGKIIIHPDIPAITCDSPGRQIDLGGIGKGFALDQLRRLLIDWDCESALLSAGASSILAFGPQSWPIDLTGDQGKIRIHLQNTALSASGTSIQGSHILHPAGETAMPVIPCKRLWTTAATAAMAEIWSTALMLIEPDEIAEFVDGDDTLLGAYVEHAEVIRAIELRM